MQRYKLNTRFLIILLVLFAALLGGGYGLWAFQVYRSAPGIKAEARKAREEGRYIEANQLWRRYIGFRPNDIEAQVEYAETQLEFADIPYANIDEKIIALAEAERMLRNNPIPRNESDWSEAMRAAAPRLDDLRERSARTRLRFQLYQDAIDHLSYLIEVRKSDNPEHHVLWLQALVGLKQDEEARDKGFAMVGYDPFTQKFDVEKAITPHEPQAYVLLAGVLHRLEREQLADDVMNQLVAANPDDYEAFLERSLYWMRHDQPDLARQDWELAHNLNKEDIDVLLSGSRLALRQEDAEQALQLAEKAQELYPENYQTYIDVARATVMLGDRNQAVATIDEGLKVIKEPWPVLQLLVFKCDLQLREQRVDDAKETIAILNRMLPSSDIPQYFEGRALIAERLWVDGVKVLEKARPGLSAPEIKSFYPMLLPDLDQFRGMAYHMMGETDRAIEAYRASLAENPDQPRVRDILARLAPNEGRRVGAPRASLAEQVEAVKRLPPSEQRWGEIEATIQRRIDDNEYDEALAKLQWAEYRYLRGQTAQAHQLLQEVLATDPPLNVFVPVVRITAEIPEAGPQAAEQLLDQAAEKFGDNATIRLERCRLRIKDNPDDLVDKIWDLAKGSDAWDVHQQNAFYKGLADYFRSIGRPGEADKALERALDLTAQDVDALMSLFINARERRDNAQMKAIQDRIEKVVGSKDERWQYTEAVRLVTLAASGLRDPQVLEEADKLSDSVTKKRPRWSEAFHLRGDVLAMQGRTQEAIDAYSRALELGPPIAAAVLNHARLLAMRQEYKEARRIAETLPASTRLAVFGKLYPEILLNSANARVRSEVDHALDVAAELAASNPDDAATQLWYADLLVRRGRLPEAEAPVKKAVELEPQNMQNWLSLIRFLVGARRVEEAEQALREARLVLPEHEMPLLLAQAYSLLGRWWQAEREFLIAHKADPDNLDRMRMLADFYLGPYYPETRDDRYTKAVPYINALLQQDAATADAESVQWARRKAAEMFARTGDYQNALKAERLLSANKVDDEMPPEDKLALARILAVRPEPGSRRRAIDLIEDVRSKQALDMDSALLLVQLYWKSDRESEAQRLVFDAVANHGENPKVWQTFIALQLASGDYDDAAQYYKDRLEGTLPSPLTISDINANTSVGLSNARTLELGVQVWAKQGEKAKAQRTLAGLIPHPDNIQEQDVQSLLRIGGLFVLIDDLENAGKVFQLYAAKRPDQALVYVKFVGAYQDVEKAFGYLKEYEAATEPGKLFPVVQTALSIINARRDEIGGSKDALVQQWLEKSLRVNPDSTALLGLKADLFEMQEKYLEAQKVYERILETPGFTGLLRARVLNNLAYLLALQQRDTPRAMELIEEARAIRGPSSDILDTEAVVYMSGGNVGAAIANLELAVTEDTDAETWFHLARAYWKAGKRPDAIRAWERAQDLGIGPEKLNRMEHEDYHQFRKDIEQAMQSGATS